MPITKQVAYPIPGSTPNPCAQPLADWQQTHAAMLQPAQHQNRPEALTEPMSIGVAYSGGADSTALLLAAQQIWGPRVVALHVNHGLQQPAAEFERHALAFCDSHGIACRVARLQITVQTGQSTEEQARLGRYQALAELAARPTPCAVVLLAQHAQDQLETVLIALSRGAGLPGLSAMAPQFERHAQAFARPILAVQGTDIRRWLISQGHAYVDDPSNTNTAFTRNRIRADVLPALEQALPGIAQAAARSAAHAAQAQGLLQEFAQLDAHATGIPPRITALQALHAISPARCANVLRYWLAQIPGATPSTSQLHQLLAQTVACKTRGHAIDIKVGAGKVRRDADSLSYCPPII